MMVVGVLVEISNKNVDRIFEYNVPKELTSLMKIGIRVLVPFGRMELEGFVLEIKKEKDTDKELKDIINVVDSEIVLSSELLELGKWMSSDTISTLISCYQVMLPKALKAKNGSNVNIKFDTYYRINENIEIEKLNSSQEKIINYIREKGIALRKDLLDISIGSLNTLIKKNYLIEEKKEHYRLEYNDKKIVKKKLTDMQQKCVDIVTNNSPKTYLLYGVTGSGKTETYMEMIDYYLKQGKTSIVLVPEISLTPQMVNRFRERFGDKIAALHSALSDGEKYDEWRRIYRGEASIVIGARSAIFAPLSNIGIIIVDEEHSESYKQSDPAPRYHARDIAIKRSLFHKCPVVLGSATPSLETMARAQKGVYGLLELPERVNGRSLPDVEIIDMNQAMKKARGHFSEKLISEIGNRLEKKEQIILLLNRRGYSSFVTCKNCGYTFKCPNCDISLTYHKSSNTLRCHYCGYGEKVYTECPECGEKSLNNLGVGTQKIEEELKDIYPMARVLRMDYDTTSRKGMHEEMIEAFRNHEYDILLGTQMVAKGLDFSLVTLVGVLNADTSLNIPDFRSSENTYSLLSQVAGRSGRAEKNGYVIIQTFNPDHYAISLTAKQDYLEFFRKEMNIRHELKYPPYYYICNIRISGKNALTLFDEANKIRRSLDRNLDNVIILGPTGGSLFKINNIFRYNIIIKYKKDDKIRDILEKIVDHYKSKNDVKVDIDFNPSQML
ncbi:MAG: primosomal protein N' [Bacilli bacterium]|nr:primosomal protein N' [Bacilli bacterium]